MVNQDKQGEEKKVKNPLSLRVTANGVQFAGYPIDFIETETKFKLEDHLESVFPIHENKLITFEQLVEYGDFGLKKLGILAMDVDNLGSTIENIGKEEDHTKFDKKLSCFFNDKLRTIISSRFHNKVYTVTAGGDDSFFVDKWNTMLELAIKIHDDFNIEFGNSPHAKLGKPLTISAALVIVDPKFPVARFAQMAEDALKDAKYNFENNKGNLSLFGEVIKWNVVEDINKLRYKFVRLLGMKNSITKGILAKARLTAAQNVDKTGLKLSDFWEMGYYLRDGREEGQEIYGFDK